MNRIKEVLLAFSYIESTCYDKRQMNIFSLLKEIKNLKTFIEISEGKMIYDKKY